MNKTSGRATGALPQPRIVFVDVEASGLTADSFPIEIGWVDREGHGESHLICPAPGWTALVLGGREASWDQLPAAGARGRTL